MPEIDASAMIDDANQLVYWTRYRWIFGLGDMFSEVQCLWEANSSIYFLLFPLAICEPLELEYQHFGQSEETQLPL